MRNVHIKIYVSTAIILISLFVILPLIIIKQFNFNPPTPKVKHGEFPFRLVYEIAGEQKVIEDVIVCDFDGFEWRGESGKDRKWKSSFKSKNERITLLDLRPVNEKNEWDQTVLELYFYWGNAEYYMGDEVRTARNEQSMDEISYMYQDKNGKTGFSAINADVAYEKYKIRLISWEAAPPIKNSFN